MRTISRFTLTNLLVALLLFGCTTTVPGEIPADSSTSDFPDENGIVLVSVTTEKGRSIFPGIEFRNLETGKEYIVEVQGSFVRKADISVDKGNRERLEFGAHGHTFALSLPPGKYEFFSHSIYTPTGYGGFTTQSKIDFSIPFEITSDSLDYIGSFELKGIYSKNIWGQFGVRRGQFIELTDQFDRDLPILRSKYPYLEWSVVSNKTIRAGDTTASLIFFEGAEDVPSQVFQE